MDPTLQYIYCAVNSVGERGQGWAIKEKKKCPLVGFNKHFLLMVNSQIHAAAPVGTCKQKWKGVSTPDYVDF